MAVRRATALALALFVFGFGEELWFRYLPEYLRALGASAFTLGLFGTLKDFLDAAYAYPGGRISDRLGTRRALLLFGALSTVGFAILWAWQSIAGVFIGIFLVMAWASLGLPATFALVGEELEGGARVVGFTMQAILKRLPIVLAPPLGGLILERFGMKDGMRIGLAASIVLSIAMLIGLGRALRRTGEAVAPPPDAGSAPMRTRLPAALRQLLIADCLIRLCEGLPEVFLVVWAIEIVRVTPAQFGILVSILMVTAIASYLPAAALAGRAEKKPFVILTYAFFTLYPLAVLASRSFGALAAASVVGGLREIGEPARKALIVDLSDPRARGRTVGVYYALRGFAVAGAAAVGGALWTIRPSLTFLIAGALGVAGTLWAVRFLPSRIMRNPLTTTDRKAEP
ncbi:MAG TPA: MFS transporter [Thermoanaerobaculia bacterium]